MAKSRTYPAAPKVLGESVLPNNGHTKGSCNRKLLRIVLGKFSNSKCFLEGFLEGTCRGFQ